MSFQPPRSLLALDSSEPLPAYSPRQHAASSDPETSSIHSTAPSYVSAAPSYHSAAPPSHTRVAGEPTAPHATNSVRGEPSATGAAPETTTTGHGLRPAPQYATGFGNRLTATSSNAGSSSSNQPSDVLSSRSSLRSMYNVAEWVPATEGLQSRHYHNVAKRRVSEAANPNDGINSVARSVFPSLLSTALEPESGTTEVPETGPIGDSGRQHTSLTLSDGTLDLSERGNPSDTAPLDSFDGDTVTNPRSHSPGTLIGVDGWTREDLEQALPSSPHEDPDLVGEEAAARYRSQRLYRAYQQQENQSQQSHSVLLQDARLRQHSQPGRPHQYSSLIPPADSSSQDRPRLVTPHGSSTEPSRSDVRAAVQNRSREQLPTATTRTSTFRRPNATANFEETLRYEELEPWDAWFLRGLVGSKTKRTGRRSGKRWIGA